MERHYDLVIVGAGPAGMAASIYGSRAGLKVLLLDNGAPGGKLIKTYQISNYPGVKSTSGVDLAMSMFEQSTAFGAEYGYGNVVKITEDKKVILDDDTEIQANAVIVATGTKERLLQIPNEKEMIGRGVSYCAVCDGAFFKNKDVVVIGGGNSALEEALYLTQLVRKVTIVIRRDVFRAEENIQNQILNNDKIEIIRHHIPKEILSENNKVSGIVLENVNDEQETIVPCSGIFPYIGQDPMSDCLKELNVLNEKGYIKVDSNMETCVKGIYAAGDIVEKDLRQVVTATNDGAIAAQSAYHRIKNRRFKIR